MSTPSVEDLLKLAQQESEQDYYDNSFDIPYYQESHRIVDGKDRVYKEHLYYHYSKWSANPVGVELFYDMIKLVGKHRDYVYIDIAICNINFDKLLGDYVRKKRESQKKERLGQVPGSKPKTKR